MKIIMIPRVYIAFLFALIFFSSNSIAQKKNQFPAVISVFNLASELPGTGYLGVFTNPVHPGISFGTEYTYNSNPKHQLFQTANLSYFFHQYAQHGIQLYSEFGYRYWLKNGLHFGPKLGIGYLHSIPDAQVFELNKNGKYDRKTNFGRAQFMADFVVQIGYEFQPENPIDVFLNYQFFMQMPFVNEYVPLLPNSALHVGVAFYPFKSHSEK
jgi:hypothetical protein